jgi:hypothetical protein
MAILSPWYCKFILGGGSPYIQNEAQGIPCEEEIPWIIASLFLGGESP